MAYRNQKDVISDEKDLTYCSGVGVFLILWTMDGKNDAKNCVRKEKTMSLTCRIEKKPFGKVKSGRDAYLYEVHGSNGMGFAVSDFGATLVSLWIPGPEEKETDVLLGYDCAAGYESNGGHLGATVGRSANRIAKGKYELNGQIYQLAQNNGENNLHSGPDYYGKRFWETEELKEGIRFTLHSPDGDQGHPGNAKITVEYTLTEEQGVRLAYHGACDQDTVMNLTNHSYFNLEGPEGKRILPHRLQICSHRFTATDEHLIPTGELVAVEETPMDFTVMKEIGRDIEADYPALKLAGGYDHNYVLDNQGSFALAAVYEASGRRMEVYTDLPGMQIYTGNSLETEGKNHARYGRFSGICFETQYFPDSVNHPSFPSPILKKGESFQSVTEYRFSWQA